MLYFNRAKLVMLSQPKTGTTAMGKALAEMTSFSFNNPPRLKHVTYKEFLTHVAPLIEHFTGSTRKEYEVVTVMREPMDWLGSWYRYRSREELGAKKKNARKAERFTGDISFEEFLQLACKKENGRSAAKVGSPCAVALNREGKIGVDRIFPYEDLSGFLELLEDRLKTKIEIGEANVSPAREMAVSPEVQQMVRDVFRTEFELHASLRRDGQIDPAFLGREIKHQLAE
jgi:hypothetical protein